MTVARTTGAGDGRRDAYSGDDVYVQIDSYFDRRTAFGFGVNFLVKFGRRLAF